MRRIKACRMSTDAKKPAANNTGNATNDANMNIVRTRMSRPASSEPVARAIPTGPARKVRLATTSMTVVIDEQIRKYSTGAPSGPSGGNSSKKRCGEKSTSRVVESRLEKGSTILNDHLLQPHPFDGPYSRSPLATPESYLCSSSLPGGSIRSGVSPKPRASSRPIRCTASESFRSGFRIEAERGGVDAEALARRGGSVVEYVSLVGAADGAVYLRAAHEEAAVLLRLDVVFVERLPEARPARAGIVFGVRREQGRPAGHAAVDSLLFVVVVLTAEGPLCALHSRDAVLLRGELVLPLFFRLLYLPRRIGHAWILPCRLCGMTSALRLLLRSGTGHLGRVTPPVDHDGTQEGDDRLAVLVVARCFHRHDADAWPRARPALLHDLASGVDRIPLEDGRGEPDLIPPEVGEDVLGDIRYALAGYQGDGEGRVDQRTAVLGLGGVGVVHVDRGRVLRKEGKPQVVCGRHCAPQWMIVDVTHLEVLEKASPPPLFDRHATPPEFGLW